MHVRLYMRLLGAAADGADWTKAVDVLFGIDSALAPVRARKVHDSHLARARWMTQIIAETVANAEAAAGVSIAFAPRCRA